jgi:hypothetical protein
MLIPFICSYLRWLQLSWPYTQWQALPKCVTTLAVATLYVWFVGQQYEGIYGVVVDLVDSITPDLSGGIPSVYEEEEVCV